ncbi:MAG: hypothetical protein ABH971_02120 [bacterium]
MKIKIEKLKNFLEKIKRRKNFSNPNTILEYSFGCQKEKLEQRVKKIIISK